MVQSQTGNNVFIFFLPVWSCSVKFSSSVSCGFFFIKLFMESMDQILYGRLIFFCLFPNGKRHLHYLYLYWLCDGLFTYPGSVCTQLEMDIVLWILDLVCFQPCLGVDQAFLFHHIIHTVYEGTAEMVPSRYTM